MANNVAASMKASIIIDKKEIISSALSAYAEAQKEIAGNKIELLVDVSDDKARERLKEISKELAGKDYVIKFKNQGIEETMKSLDELFGRIKDVINLSNGLGTTSSPIIDVKDSTVQIDKLQNKLDELSKKYDELSRKKIGSSILGKDIDLVDNEEFKRLSKEFAVLKQELSDVKIHMELFEQSAMSYDSFIPYENKISELSGRIEKLTDDYRELAIVQKNMENNKPISLRNDVATVQDKITDQIVENEERKQKAYKATTDAVMYHAGVVSKLNKAETNGRFYGSNRGTGYFGTGHYFVDSATKHELDNNSSYSKLPYTSIDISQYDNLFKATTNELASGLHNFLENLTRFTQGSDSNTVSELFSQFQKVFGETVMDMQEFDATLEKLKVFMQNSSMDDRSDSVSTQFMKSLGYGGVDTRGTRYADTRYGTVIYDLKEESILQSNITDELQKQGQMLEKINYEKGQVFDQKEDTRIQGILDQQARAKEINAEFDKLFDSTKIKQLESELDSVNNTLKKNEEIIADCQKGISNADAEARKFAKEMKSFGLDVPESEIAEQADRYRSGYQERIDGLQKERPLLEARRQELEENLETEYKLANAAKERAKAIVEERYTPIKDTFQGDTEASEMGKVATAVDEAVQAKKDFATANEGVQASVDGSKSKLELETELMERLAKSAREAADAKKEFVKANKQVQGSVDDTGKSVKKDKYKNKSKISEDEYTGKSDYYASIANQKLKNSGNTILGETVSTELVDGLVKVTAKIKTADDTWKTFSAKIDADGNMFEQRFRTITKGVDKLETELKNFGLETNPALSYGETLKKAEEIRSSLKLDDSYTIKVDSNELVTITQKLSDVKSSTTSVTQTFKSAQDAIEHFGKEASSSAEKTTVALKGVKASAESIGEAVGESFNFESIDKSLDKYNDKLRNFTVKPADGHRYPIYQKNIDDLTEKVSKLQTLRDILSKKDINLISKEDIDEVNTLEKDIDELIFKMSKMSASEKGFDPLGADKALEKIHNELQKNSGMSKEAKRQIQSYYDEIRSGNPSKPIKDLLDDMYKLIQLEREAGRAHKSFNDIFKEKVVYGAAANLAGMIGIYDIINVGRQAVDIVIDLNTQITELAKVSEATSSQIYDDFNSYAEIAKDVGGTISDTISATADWSRNGYNIPDSKELAEVAMIYKNVGDGIDIDQANEYLISTLRGFNLEAKDAMSIIDSMNEVANNEPISASGIGEALQRSAAAFNAANTSLQESIALVTSTNSVLQSPEKVGSMWTTVSARIRGAKTELEEAGLETDGMVESTSKLQAMIKGMTGFDILESDGETFKSIYDIIIGIGDEFQNLSDLDQAALLEALAGKRQSNALAATLNNIDLLKKSYQEATNAEDSAMEEQRKYQESVQYSIDRTKASLEELANDFMSSDFLKGLIDSGDKLINILDWIIDKVGVLGTAGIGAGGYGIAKFIKNFD